MCGLRKGEEEFSDCVKARVSICVFSFPLQSCAFCSLHSGQFEDVDRRDLLLKKSAVSRLSREGVEVRSILRSRKSKVAAFRECGLGAPRMFCT